MIGKTIGTYKITGTIGSGGMGEVFVGEDLMLERQVAIKQLRPELASRPDVVQRFRLEAVILAKLHHTNIATVYAFLQEGANFFLVMEYVPGWTLQSIIEAHGALAPAVAIGLFQQALDGISFAHRRHIIHRDLKPANVMLTDSGVIKVMDFGLARVLGSAHLTRTGRMVGTLEYISPEQICGEETDARSDIYALGILLYELVTGRLPFESDSEYTLVRAHVETPPPSPRHITPAVSPELEHVILQALAKAPTERFQSIEEFSLALASCVPKTEARTILSALLAVLKGNPCTTEPAEIQPQEVQHASLPAAVSARIKTTRRAQAVNLSTIEPLPPRHFRAWKHYLVPAMILASSVAIVVLLFLLGMPYTPSGPGLSSRPLDEAMLPSTNSLLVAPQPSDKQALPRDQAREMRPPPPQPEVNIPDTLPPTPEEETVKAPLLADGPRTAPPAVLPPPEHKPESKEGPQEVPPQEIKSSKQRPRGASAPKIPSAKGTGQVEIPIQTSSKDRETESLSRHSKERPQLITAVLCKRGKEGFWGMVYQEVTPKYWLSAMAFLRVTLAALSLTLSSCAAVEHIRPLDDIKVASQSVIASMRKQGEKMVRTPEQTKEKYACASYRKTMLQFEDVQVLPDMATPGKEINQRIRYAFCPFTPSNILKGSITRTVLFKGKQLFRDTTDYDFKPGTWTIDVFIGIPKEATSGVYALDVALQYDNQMLQESYSFIVKNR